MDGVGVGLTLAREATGLLLRFWRFNKRMHDRPEYLHHLRSYIDRVDRDCEGARRLILDRISSAAELDEQLRIIVDKISDLTEKVSTIVKTLEELEPTNVVGKWKIQRRTEAANTDIERLVEQILGQFQSFQLHLCILGL